VDRRPVVESDNPKISSAEGGHYAPKAISIVALALEAYRMFDDGDTPFPTQVRTLSKHLALEVLGKGVRRHEGDHVLLQWRATHRCIAVTRKFAATGDFSVQSDVRYVQ
jgi:hypothetical protein